MRVTVASVLTALVTACAGANHAGPCVEGFCLPPDAQLLSKRTPVEDFNLYQVAWHGARFTIYEGNYPRGLDDGGGTAIELPDRRAGTLRVVGGRGSVVFDTLSKWPAYVHVMGPCQSTKNCQVKSLALELRLRP